MKVVIIGATGMVGQGVLRECLLDPGISLVETVVRTSTRTLHPKLREVMLSNFLDYNAIEPDLRGFDACFFCLGVSSSSVSEEEYERLTYGIAIAAAQTLARLNPAMTFIFISGAGADNSEQGRVRWARVKGKTENALLRLPFKAVYVFRPAVIEAAHGERSRTTSYRLLYLVMKPLLPLLRLLIPRSVLTTEQIGRAMIRATKSGAPKTILESANIAVLGKI